MLTAQLTRVRLRLLSLSSSPTGHAIGRLVAWIIGLTLFLGGLVAMYRLASLYHSSTEPRVQSVCEVLFLVSLIGAAGGVLLLDKLVPET